MNVSHCGSRSISTTALRGKIWFVPHVMTNVSSLEKASRLPGVVIWRRTLRCLTGPSLVASSAALLCGGMPGYDRDVNMCGTALAWCFFSLPSGYAEII